MVGEYWVSLSSVHSPVKPVTGWAVVKKSTDRLIYVPSDCVLHFTWNSVVSASLFTNYPDCFSNELRPIENCSYLINEHQWHASLSIQTPGNFQLQMKLQDGRTSSIGFFIVEPTLGNIPLSSIVCETVLTKNLGPFSRWEPIIERIRRLQYNMIHFTPVQVLGASGSGYSIFHHHQLSDQLSDGDSTITEEQKEQKLAQFLQHFAEKGLYSICDVVWNHTAINTPWLAQQPDATYNLSNSPHLRAAYALDRALQRYHNKLLRRAEIVNTMEDVDKIMDELNRKILPSLKLWEFSVVDIPKQINEFRQYLESQASCSAEKLIIEHQHHPFASSITKECIVPGDGRRGSKTVRLSCILQIFRDNKDTNAAKCLTLRRLLDRYNDTFYKQWDEDKEHIIKNLRNLLIHERVSPEGPRYPFITQENPLFPNYFTTLVRKKFVYQHRMEEEDDEEEEDDFIQDLPIDGVSNQVCANAGWVFGCENTIDLVAPQHRIYLRRQLVVWSDSAKLRYGNQPEDSPFLWNYMKEYTCQVARLFHGVRIDNCHSTPLPIAKYLLQAARAIRPNLIVIAELFTNPESEIQYCEQLGLTFLIREAMNAKTPKELGDSVYQYSGGISKAIGSLFPSSVSLAKNPFYDSVHQREYLSPKHPKNIFMDCTHDNQPPSVLRTASDALPNATLVAITNCSIGSVLGYDQLVPHQIHVVHEKRLYPLETIGGGMECCKLLLNSLHKALCDRKYDEFHVHQEGNIFMIVRHHPVTHRSVYIIVHTAFQSNAQQFTFPSFTYSGEFVEELFVGLIRTDKIAHTADPHLIHGIIPTLFWPHQSPISKTTSAMYTLHENVVHLHKFPRGSVLAFSTKLPEEVENAKMKLDELWNEKMIREAIRELSLVDLNRVLYRTSGEEGIGTYHIPQWGDMVFCGLAGIILCFNSVDEEKTISHPICQNVREGPWLLNFLRDRLVLFPHLHAWIHQIHELLKRFYSFLLPKYFHQHVTRLYHQCVQHAIHLMSDFVKQGDSFVKALALCSVQMYGDVSSGPLRFMDHENGQKSPSLAAGLPHFASGYMRTWGRDTFISLRGLFLVTGRFDDALSLITGFASCLRHGLIPNLLDSGRNPRYNARDAVWWFVQAVQDYCEFVYPNNPAEMVSFLQETAVERYFPSDDINEPRGSTTNTLAEILREILERHGGGISFREWNAGIQIDSHMSHDGFNVQAYCDSETGFVCGGSATNCGTWMDKMGESTEFGNMGVPATPRDGAAVEIVGLVASCLRWLNTLSDHGFNNDPITVQNKQWTYAQWHQTIVDHFEKYFWVPKNGNDDKDHVIDLSLLSRRGIYKDTVGASDAASDYCFRPNLCVAMVVAPELFHPNHAQITLNNVTRILLGKLGMKTLDPSHPRYAPFYDTQSRKNYFEAKGFNYHQGPEWVWVTGYYLRARLQFEQEKPNLCEQINEILLEHKTHIRSSPWAGLPELTNKDGENCRSSCPTQAWSAATILDTLHSLSVVGSCKT